MSSTEIYSTSPPKRLPSKRRLVVVCCIAVLLLAAVAAAVWFFTKPSTSPGSKVPSSKPALSSVCTVQMIRSASTYIDTGNTTELRKVYQEITKDKTYTSDINCNYIVARFYILLGNTKDAQTSIDNIKQTKALGAIYSNQFTPPAQQPDVLESVLATIEKNATTKPSQPQIPLNYTPGSLPR